MLFVKKYKYVSFPDCKNEQQVIKRLEDKIQHYNHITMVSSGSAVKIQTCNDKYGRNVDNPYIKMIGNVERVNGNYALKFSYDDKIKYMFVAIIAVFIAFLSIAITHAADIKHTLIMSAIVLVSGGLFALNNYLNISYNTTSIEDFLKKFGEIKNL